MKLYLYLARRDRKGIILLSSFPTSKEILPTRVQHINDLKLPPNLAKEIEGTVYQNRMEYEPWIQSAETFVNFKESLKKRGFINLPLQQAPLHNNSILLDKQSTDTNLLPKKKSMIRRGSDQDRLT